MRICLLLSKIELKSHCNVVQSIFVSLSKKVDAVSSSTPTLVYPLIISAPPCDIVSELYSWARKLCNWKCQSLTKSFKLVSFSTWSRVISTAEETQRFRQTNRPDILWVSSFYEKRGGGNVLLCRSACLYNENYQLRQELLQPSRPISDTPTHFFRSHRSSTLDFHFLSHYSYKKIIMLYKGNHWTGCAGFMDASWVRLGITNADLGTSWALTGDNLGMSWG